MVRKQHLQQNTIAESMCAQCSSEGNQYLLLDSIVDYKKQKSALTVKDAFVTVRGRHNMRKTTKGWKLCVQWKDGTTTWERLADLRESNPVEVAECAVAQGVDHKPAFAWWVPHTLKNRDMIIKAVNTRYLKRTHKFGIRLPKTVEEALRIDKENGNTMWQDSMQKEMNAIRVAFKILGADERVPPGYQYVPCKMVFDVKMEDLRRKSCLVAQGCVTEAPSTITYASVVSRESVRIALTLAALNDLEVKTGDIMNAHLTAPNAEKTWTVCGPEFGVDKGKKALIVRAMHGHRSAGAAFRNHLAECMRTLGYRSCLADQDVWYKGHDTRPEDGFRYYSYILLYVNDVLCINHDAQTELLRIDKFFKMKDGLIGDPDIYLGGKLKKAVLPNGVTAWGMSSSKCIKEAISNVEKYLAKNRPELKLPRKAATPFARDYRPELDATKELNSEDATFHQSQVGIARWMVELGRTDAITETSMLASHLAMPREGHLDALLHVMAHMKNKHNARMTFDPTYTDINHEDFKDCNWTEFYGEVIEPMPLNAPKPLGKPVVLRLHVDSDHAGDKLIRRSRTGFQVFMNSAPIMWQRKRQATIKTSMFGAEFVAMKHGIEATRGLRYKLRMMGVEIEGPTYIYGDNMSVIHNTQRPESTLKKKSNLICYHAVRESVAMKESLVTHIPTVENPADICTKVIPGGRKQDHLIGKVLWDLVEHNC